jgi:ABC-type antimicrobial peptide transport system permease subunit
VKFAGETFIVTVFAVMTSLALTQVVLDAVNAFLDQSLSLNLGSDVRIWIFLIALTLTVSLLSGLYPAYVISKFRPSQVVKGQGGVRNISGFNLRRSLVVMQFFISQLFIIGTIVIVKQMDFMENQYLGFRQDVIVTVPIPERGQPSSVTKMRTLKNEILRLRNVEAASLSNSPPSSAGVLSTGFKVLEKGEEFITQVKQVDGDYLSFFDIDLLAGEKLGDQDTMTGFVVNEKLKRSTSGINDCR